MKGLGLALSDKKIFLKFSSVYVYVKHVGPGFWPRGNNLKNLDRGPLGEAMYQISKAWAFCFQTRRILKFFLYGSKLEVNNYNDL